MIFTCQPQPSAVSDTVVEGGLTKHMPSPLKATSPEYILLNTSLPYEPLSMPPQIRLTGFLAGSLY